MVEIGISNVILTIWQDPSLKSPTYRHLALWRVTTQQKPFVTFERAHNLQWQERLKPRLSDQVSLGLSDRKSDWNSTKAGVSSLLTHGQLCHLHVDLHPMSCASYMHYDILLLYNSAVLEVSMLTVDFIEQGIISIFDFDVPMTIIAFILIIAWSLGLFSN